MFRSNNDKFPKRPRTIITTVRNTYIVCDATCSRLLSRSRLLRHAGEGRRLIAEIIRQTLFTRA